VPCEGGRDNTRHCEAIAKAEYKLLHRRRTELIVGQAEVRTSVKRDLNLSRHVGQRIKMIE
jgi:hypothetical protein